MQKEVITHKITPQGLKLLRQVSAATGEKQYTVLERVLASELDRINQGVVSQDIPIYEQSEKIRIIR